jgi:hypothetical protein
MTTRKYFNNIKPLHFTRPESRKAQLSHSQWEAVVIYQHICKIINKICIDIFSLQKY